MDCMNERLLAWGNGDWLLDWSPPSFGTYLELVSKKLNHLAAILHVNAGI